jgi:hypothetical protein
MDRETDLRDFAESLTADFDQFEAFLNYLNPTAQHARVFLRVVAEMRFGGGHGPVSCVFRDGDGGVASTVKVPAAVEMSYAI